MTEMYHNWQWTVWWVDRCNQITLIQVTLIHSRKPLSSQCFNEVRIFQRGCSSFCTRSFRAKSSVCSTLHTNLNLMCLLRLRVHSWRRHGLRRTRSKLETRGVLEAYWLRCIPHNHITTTSMVAFRLQTCCMYYPSLYPCFLLLCTFIYQIMAKNL